MNPYDSVLITGGAGMLAQALQQALVERGLSAQAPARAMLDITNDASLAQAFDRYKPTLLINCAAYTKVDLAEKEKDQADAINGHAVGRLANLCKQHGVVLVHFSTDYVFDGTKHRPLQPDDPVGPQSAYGRSKLLGETLLQKHAPERWLIVRTSWLYGPGGPNFPQTMLKVARAGKPLSVIDDQFGSPTYTLDLATATLDLLDHHAAGIWHLSNSDQTNWHDFAAAIFGEFGLQAELSRTTSEAWKKSRPESAIRPSYSVLDVEPYEKLTGKHMTTWLDALARYRRAVEPVNA